LRASGYDDRCISGERKGKEMKGTRGVILLDLFFYIVDIPSACNGILLKTCCLDSLIVS
jgi:hypothetical protein